MVEKIEASQVSTLLRKKIKTISFLYRMMEGPKRSLGDQKTAPWFEEGFVYEMTRSTFDYLVTSGTTRWAERARRMVSLDGVPFQMFWRLDGKYLGRQLSDEETFEFCQLTNTKRYT